MIKLQFLKFFLIISGLNVLTIPVFSQTSRSDDIILSKIDHAIKSFQSEDYDSALDICKGLVNQYPDQPMGYLGLATIYHGIMRNYWIKAFDAEFDSLIALAIDVGKVKLNEDDENAENHFYYGAARGVKGLQHMRDHEWLTAFKEGLSGFNHVKKSYQLDSTLYDAYLGLGLFYYWKSVKAPLLKFLGFIKDERQKGIEFIKIAVDKGRFSRLEGRIVLLQIYIGESEYDVALRECEVLEPFFANDPTLLYLKADILTRLNRWVEANFYYRKLHHKLQVSPFKRCYGLTASCEYGIAQCEYESGDLHEARLWIVKANENAEKRDPDFEIDGLLYSFSETYARIKSFKNELEKLSN